MCVSGRLPFIAPEVREGIYTEKSDIYSLGIIIWQLVSKVVFPSPEIMLSNPDVYRIEPVPGVAKWYEVCAWSVVCAARMWNVTHSLF
jgi:serine/threonine protein kinase